jgi:hypothetical protein
MSSVFLFPLLCGFLFSPTVNGIEEFRIHGPEAINDAALREYMRGRREEPDLNKDFGADSFMFKKARKFAENRFRAVPEEDMVYRRGELPGIMSKSALSGEFTPRLALASAMQTQQSAWNQMKLLPAGESVDNGAIVSLTESAQALAATTSEEVSGGAVAKAGGLGLSIGDDKWVDYAEKNMRSEKSLSHGSLMFEVGLQAYENQTFAAGGLNMTHEKQIMDSLLEWYEAGGGQLKYAKPVFAGPLIGYELRATESVLPDEAVVVMPLKLMICRVTARNVVIKHKHSYLGEGLRKTFAKNEKWGLALFLLHEWFKERHSGGSKWGPFLRSLAMRQLSTPVLRELMGSQVPSINVDIIRDADALYRYSLEATGPCGIASGVCKTHQNDQFNHAQFEMQHIRWALTIIAQHAVRVRHAATGSTFLALIPFHDLLEKRVDGVGGTTFELNGDVTIKTGQASDTGTSLSISSNVEEMTDASFFYRYLRLPPSTPETSSETAALDNSTNPYLSRHKSRAGRNPSNHLRLVLPGVLSKESKIYRCHKTRSHLLSHADKDACDREDSGGSNMLWKFKVLSEWRDLLNMPPRLCDLRQWATRLHLYGDSEEEIDQLNKANLKIAGLPLPVDVVSAEEQLMLMGVASSSEEAQLVLYGDDGESAPPPQLYSAPDPTDDVQAERAIQKLASLAAQLQTFISTSFIESNATDNVVNKTRNFFQHGVLPDPGLDQVDLLILKKVGLIAQCGVAEQMRMIEADISTELMCAMRVHLMNETEVHIFSPKEAHIFNAIGEDVEFINNTAVSLTNELAVINSFQDSIGGLLASYTTSQEKDLELLKRHDVSEPGSPGRLGPILEAAITLRYRDKQMLLSVLHFLEAYRETVAAGDITFQIDAKIREREVANERDAEKKAYVEKVLKQAGDNSLGELLPVVARVPVDLGEGPDSMRNLTLYEGEDWKEVVGTFCTKNGIGDNASKMSLLKAMAKKIDQVNAQYQPLLLTLGVVTPSGHRRILGIPQHANHSHETAVFCAKFNISSAIGHKAASPDRSVGSPECAGLQQRVADRLESNDRYRRNVLIAVPVDAPDGRKLQMVIREGDQHDLVQFASDFMEFHHLDVGAAMGLAQEVARRLPTPVIQIPVELSTASRTVVIRVSERANLTNVVESFCHFYDLEDAGMKIQIFKAIRAGMSPGSYVT